MKLLTNLFEQKEKYRYHEVPWEPWGDLWKLIKKSTTGGSRREKWYEDSKKRFEETINILLEDQLTQYQETLKHAMLIRKLETFYRILQGVID